MAEIVEIREELERRRLEVPAMAEAKRFGYSDRQIAHLWKVTEPEIRAIRVGAGIRRTYKTVDTCAAEFEAVTPYMYGTFEDEDEVRPADRPRVVVLGSGPNRIGQGIEFDYACVHAAFALRDAGYETVLGGRMHFVGPDQRHGFEKRIIGDVLSPFPGGPGPDDHEGPPVGGQVLAGQPARLGLG